jgi:large subunit ribosomal protein L29
MKAHEIRELEETVIREEIGKLEKELMSLRLGNPIGLNENPVEIRYKRRVVARMRTILRERELAAGA